MASVPIVHRDDHLLIVDKPAGVLVVPAPTHLAPTVVDLLRASLGHPVHAVHRLDEETTGAMAFALTAAAKAAMEGLFRDHAILREYVALLASAPSPPAGRIDSLLHEDGAGVMRVVTRNGTRAITHYETVERRGRCTLVRCRLETGRRNQIRAHMAALGCPVAGDRKYGYRRRPDEHFPRVMLHSLRMQFRHPITGVDIDVTVPPPEPELRP